MCSGVEDSGRLTQNRVPHQVMVMHEYAANDSDELEMKAGDVVLVMTYDSPDEQVGSPCTASPVHQGPPSAQCEH